MTTPLYHLVVLIAAQTASQRDCVLPHGGQPHQLSCHLHQRLQATRRAEATQTDWYVNSPVQSSGVCEGAGCIQGMAQATSVRRKHNLTLFGCSCKRLDQEVRLALAQEGVVQHLWRLDDGLHQIVPVPEPEPEPALHLSWRHVSMCISY